MSSWSRSSRYTPTRFVERLVRCVVGLGLFGFGITLFIRSGLGLPPWDVFHLGLADVLGLSIGVVIIGVGVLILLLWIPLRQRPGLGTILNALEIGLVVDLTKPLIGEPDMVVLRVLMVAAGLLVVGIASALYIGAGLGSGPRDGLMLGISKQRIGSRSISIRVARTAIEMTVLVAGVLLGGTVGLGTVAFVLGIGPLVQLFLPRFETRLASEHRAAELT
ncbi:MAG: YczE/YyaS/YitT family protein [Actinomycetota bacterium]